MSDLFTRILARTTVAHVVAIVIFLTLPMITRLVARERPPDDIMFIDVGMLSVPPMSSAIDADDTPPRPKESESTPPVPEIKDDIPLPKKTTEVKKPDKPKINVSTTLVSKVKSPPAPKAVKKSNLTKAQIAALLAAGIPQGVGGGGSIGGSMSSRSIYEASIQSRMYKEWVQPSSLSGSGLVALVKIHVQQDGTITKRDCVDRSGNALMDDSVMKAVNAVSKLPPLPSDYGSSWDFTITFQLDI